MAELLACRRPTDPVGGDTASQHEVAPNTNGSGPALQQSTRPLAMLVLARCRRCRRCLPAAGGGGASAARQPLLDLLPFTEIWAVDFEFGAEPGENPEPVCLVAWELRSGRKLRLWRDEFGAAPPYPTGPDICSSPTTPAQKSVAISLSAGRCRSACWTCSPSSAITPTAFPRPAARACSARWPTMAWTASAPSRKTKCAT